jgi:hypothetical protein
VKITFPDSPVMLYVQADISMKDLTNLLEQKTKALDTGKPENKYTIEAPPINANLFSYSYTPPATYATGDPEKTVLENQLNTLANDKKIADPLIYDSYSFLVINVTNPTSPPFYDRGPFPLSTIGYTDPGPVTGAGTGDGDGGPSAPPVDKETLAKDLGQLLNELDALDKRLSGNEPKA